MYVRTTTTKYDGRTNVRRMYVVRTYNERATNVRRRTYESTKYVRITNYDVRRSTLDISTNVRTTY